MLDLSFSFTDKCWLWHGGKAAWYFISLPQDKSEEIKFFNKNMHEKRRGWDAVRVLVTVGNTSWETSIFPSSELKAYILPIKAEVRKKEKIAVGDEVTVKLTINI
jgi:Domain of unknown function (DUF1905)